MINHQVLLDKFEEKDKRKTLQVTLDGESIFFNSCTCQRKSEADNSNFLILGCYIFALFKHPHL